MVEVGTLLGVLADWERRAQGVMTRGGRYSWQKMCLQDKTGWKPTGESSQKEQIEVQMPSWDGVSLVR